MVPWIATAILACGLATLLWTPARWLRPNWRGILALVVGAQIYLGWHWIVAEWIGVAPLPPNSVLAVWSLLVFVALYAAQAAVAMRRPSASASPFYDWIYAGLYLDERFTRLTFRLWPARSASGVLEGPADRNTAKPGNKA
jgi:NAD(P)H-quinone oxidoreductase subunit 5